MGDRVGSSWADIFSTNTSDLIGRGSGELGGRWGGRGGFKGSGGVFRDSYAEMASTVGLTGEQRRKGGCQTQGEG